MTAPISYEKANDDDVKSTKTLLSWRDLDRLPTRPARAPVLRWWRPDRPVLAAEPTLCPDAVEDAHVGVIVVLGLIELPDLGVVLLFSPDSL